MLLLAHMSQLYGQFNMVSTLLKKRYHLWKKLGLCLTLNIINLQSLFRGEFFTSSNFQVPSTFTPNVIGLVNASSWPTSPCGKKVRRPSMFKLTQQHTNNQDVGKLFNPSTNLPPVDVHPPRYGRIYIILCGHKHFDVTIKNHPCGSCIYFIVMSTISLGMHGAWVQCKHMYPLQQKVSLYAK